MEAPAWFGGSAPGDQTVVPARASLLWADPPLWTVGVGSHIRSVEHPGGRLSVFGPCNASEHDMFQALANDDLAAVVRQWAGCHTVVRFRNADAVEIVTDAAGAAPIYTVHGPGGMVWGSSARALSALASGAPDLDWLSAYVRERSAPARGRSAWEGVSPVPPGGKLTLRSAGGTFLTEWWSPTHRPATDVVPAIRYALGEGVRVRVEEAMATSDLAGMDSTTVALLAARYGPVTGMTLHPEGMVHGGDMLYAEALDVQNLVRTTLPLCRQHLPFSPSLIALPATDEPAPSTPAWSMFSAQLAVLAAAGTSCHLTGDGGDNLFLVPPAHLADLARRGRFLRMSRDALDWARLRKQSPRPLIAAALRHDAGRLSRSARPRPSWVTDDVPEPDTDQGGDADAVLASAVRTVARSANSEIQLAASLGVPLHNPYFDGAVFDAVLSASPERRFSARRYKPLLAEAFGDLLPPAHRERAAKGVFVGDFHLGVRANLRYLSALVDGRLAAAGLITPAPLRATIQAAALGAPTIWPPLLSAVAAEQWLAAIEDAEPTEWARQAPVVAQ